MSAHISIHSTDPLLMKAVSADGWVTLEFRDSKDMARNDYQWSAGQVTIFMDDFVLAHSIAAAVNKAIADRNAEIEAMHAIPLAAE